MDNLDKITTNVNPTSLERKVENKNATWSEIIDIISTKLTYEDNQELKKGLAFQGQKEYNSNTFNKNIIENSIESLKMTNSDSNIDNSLNAKTKKILQQQLDCIIGILKTSYNNKDNRYFILGLLLKTFKD